MLKGNFLQWNITLPYEKYRESPVGRGNMHKENIQSYLTTYVRKKLFQVIFHVTYRCNARCAFCLNKAKLNPKTSREMDLFEIEKIARSMPSFPWLLISGGEPFLRKDLAEIISIFYRYNDIRRLTLPTNGLLPETVCAGVREIVERCPDLDISIVLSLDGIGQLHDQIRGVNGAFKNVLETFSLLRALKKEIPRLSLKIETVLSKENEYHVDAVIEFVRSLGPDRHVCDLARGSLSDPYEYLPAGESLEGIFPKLKAVNASCQPCKNEQNPFAFHWFGRLSRDVGNAYWTVAYRTWKENRRIIPCYAGSVSAVIYPDGDLAFCELLDPIGNLRDADYSFEELWKTGKAREVRKKISKRFCHCIHPCNQLVNILFNPVQLMKAFAGRGSL